jgi:serine/threonine protein kinase
VEWRQSVDNDCERENVIICGIRRNIVEAMEDLHDCRIDQGEGKPDSVVFEDSGRVKLINLGDCKEKRIEVNETQQTDVWSVGILLNVMVGGRLQMYPKNGEQKMELQLEFDSRKSLLKFRTMVLFLTLKK